MTIDFETFFAEWNAMLDAVEIPGMDNASWDRKAAYLLFRKGNTEMAGTRRSTTKKSPNELATKLQEALKFLSVGYNGTGDVMATHTWFQSGWGMSSNGVVSAGTPIEGLDLNAFPDTELLTDALSRVGKDMTMTVEENYVHITSGDAYEAYIPVAPTASFVPTAPDAPLAPLPDGFKGALGLCSMIISDSAQSMRDATMWLRPMVDQPQNANSLVATNGKVMIEALIGGFMPPNLCFPKAFFTAFKKIEKKVTTWGFTPLSFTVFFEDGSYLRTNLYDASAYPTTVGERIDKMMDAPNVAPPPKGFFEAVAAVSPFGDGTVFFLGGHVRSDPDEEREQWGCSVEVDKLPDGCATNGKSLLLFKDTAQQIYLGNDDDEWHRVIVLGPNYRAAIGGSRSAEVKRPVPTPLPAVGGWTTQVAEAPAAPPVPPVPEWGGQSAPSAASATAPSQAPFPIVNAAPAQQQPASVISPSSPPAFVFPAGVVPDGWATADEGSDDLL